MDYINIIKKIWDTNGSKPNKLVDSCDLLIPKIMYIPNIQHTDIEQYITISLGNYNLSSDHAALLTTLFAFLKYKRADYQSAIKMLRSFSKDNPNLQLATKASMCAVIGASYRSLGEKESALQYFQQAIEEFNNNAQSPYQQYFLGISTYHIAEIYGELKDYDDMLERHLFFMEYGKKWGNTDFENRALNGIGRAYLAKEQYELALLYLKMADENVRKKGNIPFMARNLHDLGFVYTQMQEYEEALSYYNKALGLRIHNNLANASITTLVAIGKVFLMQKKPVRAIEILTKALEKATTIKVNSKISQIYKNLSIAYEQQQSYDKALEFYKKFHLLQEEIDNVNNTKVENQKIREANTQLRTQKELIETQKYQIEATLKKLQETIKYLENFAAVAAHDLKAPIRIASSFAKILQRKYKDRFDPKDLEYFGFISENIGRLGTMIDDLLSLSKLDQNLPQTEVVDMSNAINEVQLRLKQKIEDTSTNIVIKTKLPFIEAHASLVMQLFQNVIENAIKHSKKDQNPFITISSKPFSANPDYCLFEIKDNGEGIPLALQPYVFELFNGTHKTESTGIGLATCKKIISIYGGRIWVNSMPNHGASIFFTLPFFK